MDSEIKFRLYTENRVVGYEVWNFFDLKWMYYSPTGAEINCVPFHVGKDRTTGLKDKNKEEIYEFDKVGVPYVDPMGGLHRENINFVGIVKFMNGSFYVCQNDREQKSPLSNWQEYGKKEYIPNYGEYSELLDITVLEIVGNSHENLELSNRKGN